MTLISLENVSVIKQGKTLLDNLNWEVKKGEAWAILGLNGSGKTTLLKLLMAEFFQSRGDVCVLGAKFGQGDITPIRQKIGIVGSFIAERLPKNMPAEHIVLTGKYKSSILYKAYGSKELNEAKNMLEHLGGAHLIGRRYFTLSQGEKQLLLIARSLMENPDIIILDEATSGLDLFAREKLLKLVENIKQLPHAPTILYVTHHAEEITSSISHLLLLREGKIVAAGKKEEVLTPEHLKLLYGTAVELIPIGDERYFIQPKS